MWCWHYLDGARQSKWQASFTWNIKSIFSSDESCDSRVASIMRWMWVLHNQHIIAWRDECTSTFKKKSIPIITYSAWSIPASVFGTSRGFLFSNLKNWQKSGNTKPWLKRLDVRANHDLKDERKIIKTNIVMAEEYIKAWSQQNKLPSTTVLCWKSVNLLIQLQIPTVIPTQH